LGRRAFVLTPVIQYYHQLNLELYAQMGGEETEDVNTDSCFNRREIQQTVVHTCGRRSLRSRERVF
jgi:hypothetical protein